MIYVVRAGDNLVSIARFFEVAMSDTLALNPWLEGAPHLPVGVDLRLPWPDWLPGRPGAVPTDPAASQPPPDPTPSSTPGDPSPPTEEPPPTPGDPPPTPGDPSPPPTEEPPPTASPAPTASPSPTGSPEPTAEPTVDPTAP